MLSVVIPAYNEEARLGPTLARILQHLRASGEDFEMIVVDDGSQDRTRELAVAAGTEVRVISYTPNRGKGAAVRAGVIESRGSEVLICDADLSTPIEYVDRLRDALRAGAGVAIGSRSVRGSELDRRQPLYRELMGKVFNLFVQLVALPGLWDTQCGFKLFEGTLARQVMKLCRTDGFAYDVEALLLARRLGARVEEVAVGWHHVPQSRVDPVRDSARMLMELLRIRLAQRPELRGLRWPPG
ncbi:MAG: dolichyl-phosphate beta-glucosyltransferase [Candidatus Dormibacteria bacterium]